MEKSNGFTYFELMFVVFIMSLIMVAGAASYSEYNLRKKTESETKKVVELLELARSHTIAGRIPPGCNTYGGKHYVDLTDSVLSLVPLGCPQLSSYTFENDFTLSPSSFQVIYEPFGTGITGPTCILIQHPSGRYCGKIELEQSGSITDSVVSSDLCTCP